MGYNILLGLLLLMQHPLFAAGNSTSIDSTVSKSININPAITVGRETGISIRFEYETSNAGKILLTGAAGFYDKDDYIMLDVGLGYGYPLISSNNYKVNLNGVCSYMYQSIPVGLPMDRHGITGLVELEFIKYWDNFGINIAPAYRRLGLMGLSSFSDKNLKGFNSVGIRVGVVYRFKISDK